MKFRVPIFALALAATCPALASPTDSVAKSSEVTPAADDQASFYDKLWNLPKLYQNDENPVIEEFDLIGRLQTDYFNVASDKGSTSFFEIRRFRLGVDAFFVNRHLEFEAEVDTALRAYQTPSIFYNRMTNLWARIVVSDAFNIRFGKFQPHFGYDREFSNNLIEIFERGFFDDQLYRGSDYVPGVEFTGKCGNFDYLTAVYSTNVDKEFGAFDGGAAFHAEVDYDFSKALGATRALWVLDYLHADAKNADTNVFTNYRDAIATYFDYARSRFGLVTQVAYGRQIDGKGDVYGLQIMPIYRITEKLELIGRYQLGLATESDGISTLNRQQKTIGVFTGDTYNAGYIGLNYFLYGQKFKLMCAEEYAHLSGGAGASANYRGWTTWVGFRLYF